MATELEALLATSTIITPVSLKSPTFSNEFIPVSGNVTVNVVFVVNVLPLVFKRKFSHLLLTVPSLSMLMSPLVSITALFKLTGAGEIACPTTV